MTNHHLSPRTFFHISLAVLASGDHQLWHDSSRLSSLDSRSPPFRRGPRSSFPERYRPAATRYDVAIRGETRFLTRDISCPRRKYVRLLFAAAEKTGSRGRSWIFVFRDKSDGSAFFARITNLGRRMFLNTAVPGRSFSSIEYSRQPPSFTYRLIISAVRVRKLVQKRKTRNSGPAGKRDEARIKF